MRDREYCSQNSLGNPVCIGCSLTVSGCENVPVVDQSAPTLPANLHTALLATQTIIFTRSGTRQPVFNN